MERPLRRGGGGGDAARWGRDGVALRGGRDGDVRAGDGGDVDVPRRRGRPPHRRFAFVRKFIFVFVSERIEKAT